MKAKQHARRPFCRQVRPDFPQAVSQRPAERHSGGPPPLRTQQVQPYCVTLGLRQSLQPLAHGLSSLPRAVKNQWNFSRLLARACHPAPYKVLLYRKMYSQARCFGLAGLPNTATHWRLIWLATGRERQSGRLAFPAYSRLAYLLAAFAPALVATTGFLLPGNWLSSGKPPRAL